MKRIWLFLGLLLLSIGLGVLLAAPAPVHAQEQAVAATAEMAAGKDVTEVSESVMAFIDKGKPIGHVIILLLVMALFFVIDQMRVHLLERVRAGEIYTTPMGKLDRGAFEAIIARYANSRVGRLLSDAQTLFTRSGNVTLIASEADFYREKEEHRFNTFEARMAFLADTAGGLGLLGTVWGIYRGFAAKSIAASNDDLLAAMGIALVTTFMGIVVSVIINWLSTEMGALTRNRTMAALEKIEDYRDVLVRDSAQPA